MKDQEDKINGIPISVIKRLPVYYHYLSLLITREVEKISSRELAKKLGTTASQIRQDLSHFGNFGQRGYGYRVEELHQVIGKILGLDSTMNLVLVGAGNLGRALANYPNFKKRGFIIRGIFDNNRKIIGEVIAGCKVLPVETLADFLNDNSIDIGIIAIPPENANDIARILVDGGVKGIWNFAPVNLNPGKGVLVENVHISESLMTLSFRIRDKFKEDL
jgi:redox-sensing transcriptional repressor